MDAAGRKGQDDVPFPHVLLTNNPILVNDACAVTGKVIFVDRIKPWHLCRFAANQSSAGLYAAFADTFHDVCNPFGNILPAGDIVKEKQGLCSAADNIIDAHGNTVNSDRIMLVHQKRQAQFGADTVCS